MENKKLPPEIAELIRAYKANEKVPDEQVALASMTVLDDYAHKSYPTPPDKVMEYFKLDIKAKRKMNDKPEDYQGFWADPDVKKYFDDRERIKNLNQRNKEWLEWMKKVLPDHELPIRMKIHSFDEVPDTMAQPDWSA